MQAQAPSALNTAAPNTAAPETEGPNDASAKAGTTRRAQAAARASEGRKTASASTLQRGFAPVSPRQAVAPRPMAAVEVAPIEEQKSPLWWKIAALCVLLVAAALRLWHLDLVPFHHDEGVNGDFLVKLFRTGTYAYNPTNFHGPTLYYFALVSAYFNTFLFGKPGLNDFSLRVVPALFGVGTVLLTLCLRRNIGAWASLLAAALLAISPGMVYVSRYFIHEMHFVFFTLLAVVAMLRFQTRGAWWWPALLSLFMAGLLSVPSVHEWLQGRGVESLPVTKWQFLLASLGLFFALTKTRPMGSIIWVFVASVSMAMVFGSKETAPISLVALLFAGALTWLLCDLLPSPLSSTRIDQNDEQSSARRRGWRIAAIAAGAIFAFWLVTAVFFSSFGHNYSIGSFGRSEPKEASDFFAAYDVWRKTGDSEAQAKPFLTYVVWMLTIEPPILILGALGTVLALWQRRNRFVVFCALWAFGLMFAYSKINYKTPWLMLNFVLPFAIVSGWVLQEFGAWLGAWLSSTRTASQRAQTIAWTTLLPALPILWLVFVQMRFLNFIEYDNDEPLRYETTSRYLNLSKDNKFPFLHVSRPLGNGQPVQLPKIDRTILGKHIESQVVDVKKYPYIYVHTERGYFDLLHKIDEYAARSGLGKKMPIMVASPEYWPMPWYLRDYPAGYYGEVRTPTNEVVIIGRDDQDGLLQQFAGGNYMRVGQYLLRPGVTLTLWVRHDLVPG